MADGIRIDGLDPTVNPSFQHEFAAMKDGLTVRLSLDQLRALIAAIYDPQSIADDAFDRGNHTGSQDISTVTGLDDVLNALEDALAARVRVDGDQGLTSEEEAQGRGNIGLDNGWAAQAIGVPIPVLDHFGGDLRPPTDKEYRYILLTAGEAGEGGYNDGLLTSETVSGSSPTVSAFATISLSSSILNGKIVQLINTERRFLRAGGSGTLQDSMVVNHSHGLQGDIFSNTGGGSFTYNSGTNNRAFAGNSTQGVVGGTGNQETRSRNVGVTYYMRIK